MPGFNLQKAKEQLQKYQNASSGQASGDGASLYWKPELGKSVIRIVPYKFGEPFIAYMAYWNFAGKKYIVSPATFGDADPILEYISKVFQSKDKEHIELVKKIYPKKRFYSPIVVRGDEKSGVKFWSYPKTCHEDLVRALDRAGDISDVKNGRDLEVTYAKPSGKGAYPTTKVDVAFNQSPLAATQEEIDAFLENQTNILDVLKKSTMPYNELQDLLKNYLAEAQTAPTAPPKEEKKGKAANASKTVAESAEAFDELFKED